MKKCIFFFSLLVIGFTAVKAQVKPIYFYGDKVVTAKEEATSYAVYGKLPDEEVWMFKRYDLQNNLVQVGSYLDEQLSIPHGKFSFYADVEYFNRLHLTNFKIRDKKRFLIQQGSFVNGVEQGRWLLFFPDGNVCNRQDYLNGKLHGEFVTYDKFGNIEISGTYVDGEKDGEWIIDSGEKKVVYEKGVVKSSEFIKKPKKSKSTNKN